MSIKTFLKLYKTREYNYTYCFFFFIIINICNFTYSSNNVNL